MRAQVLMIAIIGLLAMQAALPALSENDDWAPWSQYDGNPQHTGLSPFGSKENNGTLKWTFETDIHLGGTISIGADGTIYVASTSTLYALNPSGSEKWRIAPLGGLWPDTAIGPDGSIYVSTFNGRLFTMNPNGTEKSVNPIGGYYIFLTVDSKGNVYSAPFWSKTFYSVDVDGTRLTNFDLETWLFTVPSIGYNGTVYVVDDQRKVYAFDQNGKIKWANKFENGTNDTLSIGPDNWLYARGRNNDSQGNKIDTIQAIDPDGNLKWTFREPDEIPTSPTIGPDGTLFFGASRGGACQLYALSSWGQKKWSVKVGDYNNNQFSHPVVDMNGIIYLQDKYNYVYAVDSNGALKWKYLANDIIQTPLSIDSRGTVYFGTNDTVYAIGTQAPSPPRNLTATIGDHDINLSWNGSFDSGYGDITTYVIYRWVDPTSKLPISSVFGSVLNFTDTDAKVGTTYHYEVIATNMKMQSVPSNEVTAVIIHPPDPPNRCNSTPEEGGILLTWEPPKELGGSNVTNYRIYKGENPNNMSLLKEVLNDITTFFDKNVSLGMTYYYNITAINIAGESSTAAATFISMAKLPSPPANLTAKVKDKKVHLSWGPPVDLGGAMVQEYQIYKGPSIHNMSLLGTCFGNVTSSIDPTIEEGKVYYYHVVAVNIVGSGPASDDVRVEVPSNGDNKGRTPGFEEHLMIGALLVALVVLLKRGDITR